MSAISAFIPDVAIHVAGCPDPTMEHAIRAALIDFCRDTLVWNEVQDAETVSAADFPYQIPTPPGGSVAQVMSVTVDGRALAPFSQSVLDSNRPDWRSETGQPTGYTLPSPDYLTVYPLPDAPRTMTVAATYTLTRSAVSLPDWIYQQYAETIAAGTLARLMIMPGKPWTNPQLAGAWAAQFAADKLNVKTSANLSFTRGPLRVRLPRPYP